MEKAKRIIAGEYLYRGYRIEKRLDGSVYWSIGEWQDNAIGGVWYWFDAADTLVDAKWIVDRSIAMKEVA
jgi:hypothetical protein